MIYYGENKLHFDDNDDVQFVLDQHAELDFYSPLTDPSDLTPESTSLCSY